MKYDPPFAELEGRWESEADLLEGYGCTELAAACRRHAAEVAEAWRKWLLEELTISEAALESGYSPGRLREMVREGAIRDLRASGSQGAIRIRRCDLPRRPRAGGAGPRQDRSKPAQIDEYVDRLIDGAETR